MRTSMFVPRMEIRRPRPMYRRSIRARGEWVRRQDKARLVPTRQDRRRPLDPHGQCCRPAAPS